MAFLFNKLPFGNKIIKLSFASVARNRYSSFRHLGITKNPGALQDLLRRVMEIDAHITNTPLTQEYKPNTQLCKAYSTSDYYHLDRLENDLLSNQCYFRPTDQLKAKDMLHILDEEQGGEIFAFSNGSISFWGLQPSQQEKFLDLYIRDKQKSPIKESSEFVEFTVDEDEVTDLKGDVILLNPEGIQLSKLAFSYGLGRAAKLNSIEHDLDDVMCLLHESLLNGTRDNKQWLLSKIAFIYSRFYQSAKDGFLGTSDFHWAKPEMQSYVDKISTRFDVNTRIAILNRKLDLTYQLKQDLNF